MDFWGTPSKSVTEKKERQASQGLLSDLEKNPCFLEAQMSYQCLNDNNFDRNECSKSFKNYKNCRKFWEQLVQDFLDYRYGDDEAFVSGWAQLKTTIQDADPVSAFLRAKIFYFASIRNLSTDQKQMLLDTITVTPRENYETDLTKVNVYTHAGIAAAENDGPRPGSLAEVMEYIKANKPIPGVVTVDVEPNNDTATEAKLSRPTKPWEIQRDT